MFLMGSFSRRERRFPQQSMCILRPVCKQKQPRGRKTTEKKWSFLISGRRGVRKMKGVIWQIYRNQQKGIIRGDDGAQIPFRKSALSGVEFYSLSSGQMVYYRIRDGWLG